MKDRVHPIPRENSTWLQSLYIAQYDRSPELSEAERIELDRVFELPNRQIQTRSRSILHRLLQPLEDTLRRLCASQRQKVLSDAYDAKRIMLLEMHRRQKTFWDWSIEQWCECVGPTWKAFSQRYGRRGRGGNGGRVLLPTFVYLLCPHLPIDPLFQCIEIVPFAQKILGKEAIDVAVLQLLTVLHGWGYRQKDIGPLKTCISYLLLQNRSLSLDDLTLELLETVAQQSTVYSVQRTLFQVSRALFALRIIERPLPLPNARPESSGSDGCLSNDWLAWCERWRKQSPQQKKRATYYQLLKVGRWLKVHHPEVTHPAQWTYELAAEFVGAVNEMKVGEWIDNENACISAYRVGNPLSPRAKNSLLFALQTLLRDCQEWNWIPVQLNPHRALQAPRSLRNLLGPNPRVIEKELWAKILWAAMNLQAEDLPVARKQNMTPTYPLEMVRAIAIVWCFAALRCDEIMRLRVGCIRWQYEDVMVPETGEILPKDAVCFLDIPVNKTMTAYTKAVHPLVGKWIKAWQQARPREQLRAVDKKTSELVQFLFSYRGKRISSSYINRVLIPMLCRKAGVPEQDGRGRITSHRARATIASMLYNAREPLSLYELKEYLGHKHLSSTQSYVLVDPTKLASRVAKTGYLEQNMATVEVLLDQDAVMSGAAARGEVWKYYDLGHGYCTNTFWAECKHRMACARCPFYRPKTSTMGQLVEGKANLIRMLEFVRLTEEEKLLVTEGIDLHQALIEKLADVPTPAGPTRRELERQRQEETRVIPIQTIRRNMREQPEKP
jgi:integrase